MDREARDQVADTIGDFLAGRIGSREVLRRFDEVDPDDWVAWEASLELWFHYDDLLDHPFSGGPEEWDYLRRLAAALRSGLDLETVRPPGIRLARWCCLAAVVLAVAAAVAHLIHWLLAWLLAALACEGISRVFRYRVAKRLGELPPFAPFRDEAQWRRSEWLLDGYNLRPYDPEVHDVPYRSRSRSAFMHLTGILPALAWAPLLCILPLREGPLLVAEADPAREPHPAPDATQRPLDAPATAAPTDPMSAEVPGWVMYPLIAIALILAALLFSGIIAAIVRHP